MTDYDVIYDPERGVAVLIDFETFRALGPVAAGDNAAPELRAFMTTMPSGVLDLGSHELTAIWAEYWGREFSAAHAEGAGPAPSDVEPDDNSRAYEAALAERTAAESGPEPPDAAPADTDVDENAGSETAVVTCYNCNGDGMIQHGEGEAATQCAMCQGSGKLTLPVAS